MEKFPLGGFSMTYCVGIQVEEGLVLASDTRTSASFDDVRVYTKMHVFDFPGDRSIVLMSAGNLGTSQAVMARLQRDISDNALTNLRTPRHLFEVAEYVGHALVAAQAQVASNALQNGVNVESTLILGGQIAGEAPGLFLIYPLGNCIAASPETPYLQIGESKYGKPILDYLVAPGTPLEDAARCALLSLDSTIRSNVSVGLPIDLVLLRTHEIKVGERMRLEADAPFYRDICSSWTNKLADALQSLPRFAWEPGATRTSALPQAQRKPASCDDQVMGEAAAQQ
jgi:putative proteasome-type protease